MAHGVSTHCCVMGELVTALRALHEVICMQGALPENVAAHAFLAGTIIGVF